MLEWIVALLLAAAGAVYMYLQQQKEKEEAERKSLEKEALLQQQALLKKTKTKPKKVDITAQFKKKHGADAQQEEAPEHASCLHVLKNHKFGITAVAYSPNGRFVATSSTDRTIRVYLREALADKQAKHHQINIEYDHATALTFSSDGRTLVCNCGWMQDARHALINTWWC